MRNLGTLVADRAAPARAAAAISILFGLVSLTGWLSGVETLTSVIPGAVQMKANTALCIALCGSALLLMLGRAPPAMQRIAQLMSGVACAIGVATLAEYLFAVQFGIDEIIIKDGGGAFSVFRGRMSPFSAAAFVAIAASLTTLPHRRLQGLTKLGASFGLVIGMISLLGYLWDAGEIITDQWLPPVALNTACCFMLLGGAILLAPAKAGMGLDERLASLTAVETKILTGFVVALLLLMVGGSYTYRTDAEFAASVEWVAHTQEVRRTVAAIYGSLAGAEIALRDYVLTKDESDRAEYQRLVGDVQARLAEAKSLTRDNPIQQRNIDALRPIVDGRLTAMASTLTAFADFGLPAARAVINLTRKTDPTREVHSRTELMDSEEVRLLTRRASATTRTRQTTLVSLLVTLAVASGLFTTLFRGIHREMCARREAENALRASDRYNRTILDSSPDCLSVLTLEGRVARMTPRALELMDIDDFSRIENSDWGKIWTDADRTAATAALDAARSGVIGRFQGFCPTFAGIPKWWDVIIMPIFGSSGLPEQLLAVARDISDVKKKEDELRGVNRFLDSLFESLPLMVFVKDARRLRYLRLNREYERMSGFSREQLIGKSAHELVGEEQAAAVTATDRQAVLTGKMVEIPEENVETPDFGRRIRHTMKLPIFDAYGTPQYLLGISTDVTARKLAEQAIRELNTALETKASQLEATNKELESFSYSVSHDLRAPLRAIDGFALMIEEDYSDRIDAEGRRYIAVIRENSKRMGSLIDDLLQFSRLGRLPFVSHDINVESLVREVVEEALTGHDTPAPRIDIDPLPPARGDRGLLRQVWMNLISNAIKYSGKAQEPRIQVTGKLDGAENHYSVRDNGVGFNMEYVEKLFGVFQRLHRADEFSGTGVGLAIVHRVVTRHGGRVWAEGKINEGAVFSFALPRE